MTTDTVNAYLGNKTYIARFADRIDPDRRMVSITFDELKMLLTMTAEVQYSLNKVVSMIKENPSNGEFVESALKSIPPSEYMKESSFIEEISESAIHYLADPDEREFYSTGGDGVNWGSAFNNLYVRIRGSK